MSVFIKMKKVVNNPILIFTHLCRHWPFNLVSDATYLKIFYRSYNHKKLDLQNPKGYNAIIQWLKLHDHDPRYTDLTDKLKVRKYVANKIGEQYLVPIIGVWKSTKDIQTDILPDKFVLKCNHDSASVVICRDKKSFDFKAACKKLKKSLNTNFYYDGREFNYKNIDRRIIAEQFLNDDDSEELTDYKIFCFDGKPVMIQIDKGRFTDHVRNLYSIGWEFIDAEFGCKNSKTNLDQRPVQMDQMIELAKKLSSGFVHVRVDFYIVNGQIYFGEMTFHPGGGSDYIYPNSFDELWGSYFNCCPLN